MQRMEEVGFSVVIPAFNREATLGRSIESALAQSHPPLQILVVDDGSTDSTSVVASGFGDAVRVIRQPNGGASSARNLGVDCAGAEWIAFLDSDDHWTTNHLLRLAEAIRATEGRADTYFADMIRDTTRRRLWEDAGFVPAAAHYCVDDATSWAAMDQQPTMLQASTIRRSAYQEVGGLAEHLRSREDTHLFLRLLISRTACAVNHVGTVQTDDDSSGGRLTEAIGATSEEYWIATHWMYRDVLDRYPELSKEYRDSFAQRCAAAQLKLAAFAYQRKDYGKSARLSALALSTSPPRFVAGVRNRVTGFVRPRP